MQAYMTQAEAARILAARQMHGDPHPGYGVVSMPTHDDIAKRAYDFYVRKGRVPGQCQQNWHQAEYDLRTGGCQP